MTYAAGDLAGPCRKVETHTANMQLGISSNGTQVETIADTVAVSRKVKMSFDHRRFFVA